ncbi:MAG: hypothetical protein EBZ47_06955 [Chlamydiae bacterium]|nr:hypothetical protein [Chlamydiota bacterium]
MDWFHKGFIENEGIITGCDKAQEWMLPYFYKKYAEFNQRPISFIDFGMSNKAKEFCRSIGNLYPLQFPKKYIPSPCNVSSSIQALWNHASGRGDNSLFWYKYAKYHHKPLAFLMTPYKNTLWLDVDCEVMKDLSAVFDKIQASPSLCIVPRLKSCQKEYIAKGLAIEGQEGYNSGVVGYGRESSVILDWANETLHKHHLFMTDEDLFASLCLEKKYSITHLDAMYNWMPHSHGWNPEAAIFHWVGEAGKHLLSLRSQTIF